MSRPRSTSIPPSTPRPSPSTPVAIEPSPLALALSDEVLAMMASDVVAQETLGMERSEYRRFLALRLQRVLAGRPGYRSPNATQKAREEDAQVGQWGKAGSLENQKRAGEDCQVAALEEELSQLVPEEGPGAGGAARVGEITHTAAVQLLEQAPGEVKKAYADARGHGRTPAEALEMALHLFHQVQEHLHGNQCIPTDGPDPQFDGPHG